MRIIKTILFILILSLVTIKPVSAQSTPALDAMQIEIWPEYDRSDVLVIYRVTLSSSLTLPAQASVHIPRSAGSPYSLAWQDMDGLLYNLPYTTEVQGDWLKINFSAPSSQIQVEYYDPSLTRDQSTRSFDFSWVCDTEIKDLSVSVQQPVNASDMQITPDFGTGQTQSDGLIYYTKDIGHMSAGATVDVALQYQKSDETLSVSLQPVQPSQPLNGTTPGKTDFQSLLLPISIGVGAILIVTGVGWFLIYRNRSQPRKRTRNRHSPAASPKLVQTSSGQEQAAVHCHQCGRKASPGDLFCRTCGTRLRTD